MYVEASVPLASQVFWPLVKLVKIRCNAPVLSKGTVLVDLPGNGDANPARNAIAQGYLQNAHSIWVLVNAERACDDILARGDSRHICFKIVRILI